MAQPSVHGRFIWQELMTDDTAGAAEFYSRIIGWHVKPPEEGHGDYRVFGMGRHEVGGVMSLPSHAREAGARPHWLPYIGADDVDAAVSGIEALGGKVLRAATDVPHIGRYAVLADPQGAAFGIYRPERPVPAPGAAPGAGEFAWQELATSDFEAAFRFYSQLFGWEILQRMDMGPAGTYLIFGRGGVRQGGIYKLSAQMPAPYWLSYISVREVDAAVSQARELSARVVNGPMDVPDGGRIAQLLDKSGVLFAIHSRVAAASAQEEHAPKPAVKRAPRPASAGASSSSSAGAASSKAAAAGRAAPSKASPAKQAAKQPARKAAGKPVAPAAKKAPKKAAKKAGKKTAGKAAKKVARKTARKSAKKAVRRGVPARAGRAVGKSVRRAAKKSARRATGRRATAKKTAGKRGGSGRGKNRR